MSNPANAFAYKLNPGSLQFVADGVNCAIDFVVNSGNTQIMFGLLERDETTGMAWWMGPNATTAAGPAAIWQTSASPVYDVNATLMAETNKQGVALITSLKPTLNSQLAARFPAGGTVTPPAGTGQFTDDNSAMAWLLTQLAANFKVVGTTIQ